MFKKILKNSRGDGYIDVVVFVLCAVLIVALGVKIFPIYIVKQKVDTFATELLRTAEITGEVGAKTSEKEQKLRADLGISPTVTWQNSGQIQLGHDISVTVTLEENIGLFADFGRFPVTLRGEASGKSEVYYK